MTRKLLSAMALMVAVFFTGSLVAQAADITFGGQFRPRLEVWEQEGFNEDANANYFVNMRVRLNAKIKVDENTSAFIQMQTNTRWGSAPSDPNSVNDTSNDFGLHQAYFTLKNVFGMPVSVRPGRQEIVLDGHRLFGHTGWTQGAQSHDAIRVQHSHNKMTLAYYFSKSREEANQGPGVGLGSGFAGTSFNDNQDQTTHILWANIKGLVGDNSSTSGYLVFSDQNQKAGVGGGVQSGLDGDLITIGARHAGGMGQIDYRGEYYYQSGNAGQITGNSSGEIEAFMLGLRVGYKMPAVQWKPKITLWFDYLSGSDSSDFTQGDVGAFNTLFDTGHKFYGHMDLFLNNFGAGTSFLGLIDLAAKVSFQPMAKVTVKVDIHHFDVAEDQLPTVVPGVFIPVTGSLGQELDLSVHYKYSPSVKLSAGYSRFFADDAFYQVSGLPQGGGPGDPTNQDADWAYVQADLKF